MLAWAQVCTSIQETGRKSRARAHRWKCDVISLTGDTAVITPVIINDHLFSAANSLHRLPECRSRCCVLLPPGGWDLHCTEHGGILFLFICLFIYSFIFMQTLQPVDSDWTSWLQWAVTGHCLSMRITAQVHCDWKMDLVRALNKCDKHGNLTWNERTANEKRTTLKNVPTLW